MECGDFLSVYYDMQVAVTNTAESDLDKGVEPNAIYGWVEAKLFILTCHTPPPKERTELNIGTDFWEDIKNYVYDDFLIGCLGWGYKGSDDIPFNIYKSLNSTNCPLFQELEPFNSNVGTGYNMYAIKIPAIKEVQFFYGSRTNTPGSSSDLYVPMRYPKGGYANDLPVNISAGAWYDGTVEYSFLMCNNENFDETTELWVCELRVATNGKIVKATIDYNHTYGPGTHFIDFLRGTKPDGSVNKPPTDPFNPGGSSSEAGGGGDFNNDSTPINIPSLPSVSAVSTGFITLFNPSISQLQELANYMWSELFDLDTLRKLFADPMDAILGLSIVPVSVPNGGTSLVTVGNISTGVSMTKAASQYVAVDCGVINVNEYWGAYLDYDPFTKAEIYLPYIGTHPIAVDDIMGKSVHVVYHVDILSGACCAYIQCGESVLYSFIGQCSCSIPVTGNDWTNVINGALNIAGAIGSMVATGGATAPMAVGAIASTAVNSFKPAVEKSGSISGMGGMLGIQVPYLILTRPRQALPYNQNKFIGYPSFVTATLSDLSGYTEIDSIHLEGIPATDDELSEIESLLKRGVIF